MKRDANINIWVTAGEYFPHIDGLRAIAIIPVVVYHLFPKLCPGGFAGVDVFFVISGFLITSGIIRDLKEGSYSITDFYVRRIKRILPAYVAVIGFVLLTTPLFFAVNEAKSISSTALYSIFYSANIYFYNAVSYFDLGARHNPLLHLWSLGVEEQFYLVIPICVWLLWKIKRKLFLFNLTLLLIVSFALSAKAINEGHSQFAFFMLPSRAWELLAGAILSQLPPVKNLNSPILRWRAVFGLILILISYSSFNDATPFPGWNALPSVLGAAFIIRYGNLGFLNGLLCYSPSVFVGKVSYSLYLWHWPIFAMLNSSSSVNRAVAGGLATIIASYLSWRYVETPVRRHRVFNACQAFSLLAISTVILGAGSSLIQFWPNRNGDIPKNWNGVKTWYWLDKKNDPHRSVCTLEDLQSNNTNLLVRLGNPLATPSFVLWGDSHALAFVPGMDIVAKEHDRAGLYINLKQNFTLDEETGFSPFDPQKDREPVFKWLQSQPKITEVILVNCWFLHLRSELDIQEAINICDRLHRLGKHVFIMQSVPRVNETGLRRLSWGLPTTTNMLRLDEKNYVAMVTQIGETKMLAEIKRLKIAEALPVDRAFYDGSYFLGTMSQSFFADNNHLNTLGAIRAFRFLAPFIWRENKAGETNALENQ